METDEDLTELLDAERRRLRLKEDFPRLGSFAKLAADLRIEDPEFWGLFGKLLLSDRFVFDFGQVVDCLEAFPLFEKVHLASQRPPERLFAEQRRPLALPGAPADPDPAFYVPEPPLPGGPTAAAEPGVSGQSREASRQFLRKLYAKLEFLMVNSIWETNMTFYARILASLVAMRSTNRVAFKKVENHVLNNLSMHYPRELLVDVLLHLSRARCTDLLTFQRLQHILTHGSFDSGLLSRISPRQFALASSLELRKVMLALRNARETHPRFELDSDLKSQLAHALLSGRLHWTLADWVCVSQLLGAPDRAVFFLGAGEEDLLGRVRQNLLRRLLQALDSSPAPLSADSELTLGLLAAADAGYSQRDFETVWEALGPRLSWPDPRQNAWKVKAAVEGLRHKALLGEAFSALPLLPEPLATRSSYDLS